MGVAAGQRWRLVRDVICLRKSGCMVVQLGQRYITWVFHSGELGWIASSDADHTLTEFLVHQQAVDLKTMEQARSRISESQSLGAVLVRAGAIEAAALHQRIEQHAISLSHLLLQTGTHLFWSDRCPAPKTAFVAHKNLSFSRILLSCERSAVEVRSAVEFMEEMPQRYRVEGWEMLAETMQPQEKRMLAYLKRGSSVEEMLGDPELDRMTCYRLLLLLWISGKLHPLRAMQPPLPRQTPAAAQFWQRARQIPADWIVPLAVGAILGALLAPSATPLQPEPQQMKMERLDRSLHRPAWQLDAKPSQNKEEEEK